MRIASQLISFVDNHTVVIKCGHKKVKSCEISQTLCFFHRNHQRDIDQLGVLGRQVVVLGMGISGQSAAEFLLAHGASVHAIDRDSHVLTTHPHIQALREAGVVIHAERDVEEMGRFDLMILSPGIPFSHPLVLAAQVANVPIIGEIELGCRASSHRMMGVTGTNGKTTVALLIAHILNASGQPAQAVGNIGVPLTRALLNTSPKEILVLELSSYQIETLDQRCLERGVILNITPDHLDRYRTMEAYARAKCKIERALKPNGYLYVQEKVWSDYGFLFKENNTHLYGYSKTAFISTNLFSLFCAGQHLFELPSPLKNHKSHDLENFLAAFAICADQGVPANTFLSAWESFKKPPHRIEFVGELEGVRYYDDSKGTNIDAVIRAVQSLEGTIVLIAGGVDKGSTYNPWLEEFKNKVKLICAIGEAAAKIGEEMGSHLPVMIFSSLEEAVCQAARLAQPGESILLSPGCASFDMFKDYAHRGREFQRIVRALLISKPIEEEENDKEGHYSHRGCH